ncbi:hypothetical protein GTW51_13500 [Aurantimonas aggregata]|uniref:Auto-transporter adhesin head GIN domain-containing protein n=1 Tax=Aurantimonas aggregata TaxID=2047720 RepID=A0A6L9MJ83_9HYPH|nr:hypothetical protein [Aurantimonas aggregata]NDV87716.1 hypothetical protein [Aurantimonas aggregata]
MKTALTIAVLLAATPFALAGDDGRQSLDVSSVTAIAVTGDASVIDLKTAPDGPFVATLAGRRTGWFARWYSSWSTADCRPSSRMRLDGTTLVVDVTSSSWFDLSDCTVELIATVRPQASVSVAQAASQVKLTGDFSTVTLDNEAADFALDGHAAEIALKSKALRSHLTFDKTRQSETVSIDAEALDVDLAFVAGTAISYTVTAAASMVDSALANTPGAKPAIDIRGQFVRASIR